MLSSAASAFSSFVSPFSADEGSDPDVRANPVTTHLDDHHQSEETAGDGSAFFLEHAFQQKMGVIKKTVNVKALFTAIFRTELYEFSEE